MTLPLIITPEAEQDVADAKAWGLLARGCSCWGKSSTMTEAEWLACNQCVPLQLSAKLAIKRLPLGGLRPSNDQ